MKKWKCEKCIGKPCILEIDVYDPPKGCPVNWHNDATWEKITDKSEQKLPKLTADVFNRPDCPEWAKYAAVDESGEVWVFSVKPTINVSDELWCCSTKSANCTSLLFKADASDWQNSLIERPAKLPDWCKVGAWCYCLDDDGNPKYFKITRIEDGFIYGEDWDIDYHFVRQARIRPWTFEEAPVVLKVKDPHDFALAYLSPFGGKYVIAYHHPDEYEKLKLGEVTFTFSAFADIFTQIDGSPCGVLEHMENGEWVK